MNEKQKQKIKLFWKKILAAFAMYALLPLFCGLFLSLFLYLNSVGEYEAVEAMADLGKKSVFSLVGGTAEENEEKRGFYFLSPELSVPLSAGENRVVGCATYFASVLPLITPAPTEETEEAPPAAEIVYESLPAGAVPVIAADLSSASYAINTTNYAVSAEDARNTPFPSSTAIPEEGPLVLVLHTHGTECYFEDKTNLSQFAAEGVESYFLQNETSFRTEDPDKSVVRVGSVFAETLNENGIPTIHCTVMHDKDDFNSAYEKSAETVKEMLRQYPSIQYVVDLHRDSIERSGSYVKSLTTLSGEKSAQVMLVVGTNQNGRHPNWRQNLAVATAWRDSMDTLFPSLSRSLYLRTARFNQEYLPGCLLLEVGSAANTLEEAETAAKAAAESFAEMILSRN